MRRSIQFSLAAVIVVLCASTILLYQKYRQSTTQFTEMQAAEETTRIHYGNAINSIAAIQDSLNAIILSDEAVKLTPTNFQSEQRLTESQGDEVLARISILKAGLERTKGRIGELDADLRKKGIKIAGLQKMITSLKHNVTEKEGQVTELTDRVATLETRVTGLVAEVEQGQSTIQQQAQNIEDKRKELGTIFYTIGTKQDLSKAGVIVAKGGVLGMGKTIEPSRTFNETAFTALDTDQQSVVRIPSAKAQVISSQPVASYELAPIEGGMELRILDSKEFRKIKHLVIMTG